MEFQVQEYLLYLIYTRLLVHAILILAYSKGPCVFLKINICCIILSCFQTFYNVLCDIMLISNSKFKNKNKK